jgi:hypothetical protein
MVVFFLDNGPRDPPVGCPLAPSTAGRRGVMSLKTTRDEMWSLLFGSNARTLRTDEDWMAVQDFADRWFSAVKAAETEDKFHDVYKDNRMTIRGIKEDRQTGYYREPVPIRGYESGGGVREVKQMQGVGGLIERMKASNWGESGKASRTKYEKGLHDVSAVLLNGARSLRIGGRRTKCTGLAGIRHIFLCLYQEKRI